MMTSDTTCSRSSFFQRAFIHANAKARKAVMAQSLLAFRSLGISDCFCFKKQNKPQAARAKVYGTYFISTEIYPQR